nr:kielin/chordin-like protein isoform X2 [Procambarus clarkii]
MGEVARLPHGGGSRLRIICFAVQVVVHLAACDGQSLTLRSSCENPKECCKFAPSTQEFHECCHDQGCCPIDCDDSSEEDLTESNSCDEAWSCCSFRPQSQDFKDCCQKFGCCPACGQTSQGCCYNGKIYGWGTVVEDYPDFCMQLVCAAQKSSVRLLTAVIVPVKLPLSSCQDSFKYWCVDETGLVQPEGASWKPDYCHHCQCHNSTVLCPRPPHDYCVEIPGPCCPTWNCSIGCTDDGGQYHELGSSWYTSPCLYHTCTTRGVVTRQESCHLTTPEHESCEAYTPEGECCQRWRCSGCTDESGVYYELGHEWIGSDPCVVLTCTEGGIEETRESCVATGPPHAGCHGYTPAGACCPKWNCSGCVDDSGYHPLFDIWKSDPCSTSFCTRTGIQTSLTECHLTPAPHFSCQQYTQPGKCCPEWNCSGCFDSAGGFRDLGHEWSTGNACYIFKCTREGITLTLVQCPEIRPPHPSCSRYTPVGECCPKWNCSACIDPNGQQHSLYEVWKSDLCTTHFCTRTGIQTTRDACDLGPAPHPSCRKTVPVGECCPDWICSGCFDSTGHHHDMNSKWRTGDPCLMFVCTEEGIVLQRLICEETSPLHPSCYAYKAPGECCSKWNCSGCLDIAGVNHSLYDVWKTDSCTTHYCTRDGVKTTRETCTLGPAPHPSCQAVTKLGECCPEWQCSACLDSTGKYHDLGSKWSRDDVCVVFSCTEAGIVLSHTKCEETLPPHPDCYKHTVKGECCPKWNCSGCIDAALKYHPLHDVWKTDQCTTRVCSRHGIQTTRETCQLEPIPHQSCKRQIPVGQCCPVWNCSGCFVNKNYHNIGEEWPAKNACMIYTCTKEGLKINSVKCIKTPPPHPTCTRYTPDTECCPTWNCSGCTDDDGKFHPLNDVWKTDACTTEHCTKTGILSTVKECTLGPAPDQSCVELTMPGECCPRWKCRGCLDKDGKYHDVGKDWSTEDPCTRLLCTEGGVVVNNVECKKTPAPHPDCYEYTPVGECCQKWNCSGCTNSKGIYYPLYKVWKEDPCTTHVCTGSGIQVTKETCALEPAPHPSCQRVTPPGKCCQEWTCRGCFDATGNFHDLGEEWRTKDPCTSLLCTGGGIQPKFLTCIETRPPHPDCLRFIPSGECCPKWNCSGCTDSTGAYHRLSEVWTPDPCTTMVCTNAGIKTTVKHCSLEPALHQSCQRYTPPGMCCPEWKCSGCVDNNGTYHVLYSAWKTDPCTTHTCTSAGVTTTEQLCPPQSAPHPGCQKVTSPGECCPRWQCSGCTDNTGRYHPLHKVWQTDPCTLHNCTSDGIKTIVKECRVEPAPHATCQRYTPPGECCQEWQCRGCIDSKGEFYELGQKWRTEDPCLLLVCMEEDIAEESIHCIDTLPPHPSCSKSVPLGECCPRWNCRRVDSFGSKGVPLDSGCVDEAGSYHQLYKVWKTDACTTHFCTSAGIKTDVETCYIGPALDPSCQKYIAPGECCPEWDCSGCTDLNGTYHQLYDIWKPDPCTTQSCTPDGIESTVTDCYLGPAFHPTCQEYIPPGECCPVWQCSGCTDDDGTYHPLHEVWQRDACTTYTCTITGIQTTVTDCYLGPPLHPTCHQVTPPGECCPAWQCSGCTEHDGTYHPLHDVWKSNPCTTHACTTTGINTTLEKCSLGPATHAGCQKATPPGKCCPEWNCSGCVVNGTYHPVNHVWKTDACTSLKCSNNVIVIIKEKCALGPAPHPGCREHLPKGQCCPTWNCSNCVDYLGGRHSDGETWQDPHNPCKHCTCRGASVSCAIQDCAPPPPWPCDPPRFPGQCCPNYCQRPTATSIFSPGDHHG